MTPTAKMGTSGVRRRSLLPSARVSDHSPRTPTETKYGPAIDLSFSGIVTFAHLPHHVCLTDDKPFDVAILGAPFDVCVGPAVGRWAWTHDLWLA